MSKPIIIVGAGLAGLVCARTLLRAGRAVLLLEASDAVGGRVRSDHRDGFILNRGFQVLFTAYPAAGRQLDIRRLHLCRFDPGAVIARAAERHILSDPIRDFPALIPSVLTPIVPFSDKLRTALLGIELLNKPAHAIFTGSDETTESYLRGRGFTEAYIENFIRPFFGSIFQDDSLTTSAQTFQYDFKMLAQGDTVIPAAGMGAISEQIAEEIFAAGCIRLNSPVRELMRDSAGTIAGVRTDDGEVLSADTVVVATPAPETARLTGLPMPEGQVGTTTLYYAGTAPVFAQKKIILHANQNPFLRNAAQITNVAPMYAPPGEHLLSATALGVPDGDDFALFAQGIADLRRMVAGDSNTLSALDTYRSLAVYRVPYGQFAQPPGVYQKLPDNTTRESGLVLAGEFTRKSSINGAMESGERAAELVLRTL